MNDITELLLQARAGKPEQLQAVFSALYPRLRSLAAGRLGSSDNTMTPTVLVHETYLRLTSGKTPSLADRKHFYATAARAMRWILVDHARRTTADKRGGGKPEPLREELAVAESTPAQVEMLHLGLEALDRVSSRRRQIVELHYFAGLQFAEIAELLECSERTVYREWTRARAFLQAQMSEA